MWVTLWMTKILIQHISANMQGFGFNLFSFFISYISKQSKLFFHGALVIFCCGIKYIPVNIQGFACVLLCLYNQFLVIRVRNLPMSFRVALLFLTRLNRVHAYIPCLFLTRLNRVHAYIPCLFLTRLNRVHACMPCIFLTRLNRVHAYIPCIFLIRLRGDFLFEYQFIHVNDMWIWHMEAETKWTPFRRRHFQMDFLEWKCMNTD